MKIMLINYAFPPIGGAGVQRISKLAEFLIENNHNIAVITNKYNEQSITKDASLLTDSIKKIKVLTTRLDKYSKALIISSDITNFINKIKPDVIISSSPKTEAHLLAKIIKEKYDIRWIADFRDIQSEYTSPINYFFWRRINFIEKEITKTCDTIIVISDYHKQYIIKKYRIKKDKILVVMNGYDKDDFLIKKTKKNKKNTISLVHVGTFYGKRSPFFLMLNVLLTQIFRKIPIELTLIGRMGKKSSFFVKIFNYFMIINTKDEVSHHKAVKYMINADVLILVPGRFGKGVITGKVFEYLITNRPIINLYSIRGPLNDILEEVDNAFNIPEYNYNLFAKAISAMKNELIENKNTRKNIEKYERKEQFNKINLAILTFSKG